MLHSRRHVMDIAMVAVSLGVTASAARKPSAARQIPFLNRMAIAVVLALAAVLAFASAAIAQIMPSAPIIQDPSNSDGTVVPSVPALIDNINIDSNNDRNGDGESGSASVRGAPRLLLSARPRRDSTLPLRFRLSGRLKPTMGIAGMAEFFGKLGLDVRGLACNGGVTIAFTARGRTVARRQAFVTSHCRFRSGITIGTRRRVGRARRLKATARFGGNRLLAPVRRSITLHIG